MLSTRVFINYKQDAEPDHSLAVKIESFLKSKGYTVFRDESVIRGGDEWPKRILVNLKKTDIMISLVSNLSMRSDWVINEIDEAKKLSKPLLPIMLEDLDSEINFTRYQPRFTDIQYITAKRNKDVLMHEILSSVRNLLHIHPTGSHALQKYLPSFWKNGNHLWSMQKNN